MNLDTYEIEHLQYLVKWFGCTSDSAHSDMPHKSECERLSEKLSAMKIATQAYWSEIQKDIKVRV